MQKKIMFVVKSILMGLMALVIITTPQIIAEVWGFMGKDLGYMWAVNMVIAMILALVMFNITKNKMPRWITWRITALVFVIAIVLCESIIWHPAEIGTLISTKITARDIGFVAVGIVACTVVRFFFDGASSEQFDDQEADQ